jgi:hypothetical protein
MFLPYKSGKISSLFREFEQSSKVKLYSLIDENIKKGNTIVMPDLMNPGPNGEINLREYINWNKALKRHSREMVALGAMNMMKSYMKQGTSFFMANYILGNGTDKKLWENLTYYFGWTYNFLDSAAKIMGNALPETPQAIHELIDAIYIQTYAGDKNSLAIQRDTKGVKSNMIIDKDREFIRKISGGLGQSYGMEQGLMLGIQWFGKPEESKYANRVQSELKNHVMFKAPLMLYELVVEGKEPQVNPVQVINPLTHDKSDNDYLTALQKRNPEQNKKHGAVIDWLFKKDIKKK